MNHLQMATLSKQHAINLLLNEHYSNKTKLHHIVVTHLISKQCLKIKSSIMDTNNWLNEVFSSFDSLNKGISPGFHLIDLFSFISVN